MDTDSIRIDILNKLRNARRRGLFNEQITPGSDLYDLYQDVMTVLEAEGLIQSILIEEKGRDDYQDIKHTTITPKGVKYILDGYTYKPERVSIVIDDGNVRFIIEKLAEKYASAEDKSKLKVALEKVGDTTLGALVTKALEQALAYIP